MAKMQVEWVPIKDVHPYENNPRNNDDAVESVAASIEEFGWQQPIVVDKDGVIIAGHTRLKAAQRLMVDTVPVVKADDLTEEQVAAYRLADNKVSELAGWDFGKLEEELNEITDIDMGLFGFDMGDFGNTSHIDENGFKEEEPIDEEAIESKVKDGEVWVLGNHRLMCGDSTNGDNVAVLMNDSRADICFTSPPYNMGRNRITVPSKTMRGGVAYGMYTDDLSDDDYGSLLCGALSNALKHCDDALFNIGILGGSKRGIVTMLSNFADRFCDILVWQKDKAIPLGFKSQYGQVSHSAELIFCFNQKGTRNFTHPQWGENELVYNVIETANNDDNQFGGEHRAAFPVAFAQEALRRFTADSVLDLFGGTGTTLIAAESMGRQCYMMELDPHYCDIIIERWENLTGETAVKEQ